MMLQHGEELAMPLTTPLIFPLDLFYASSPIPRLLIHETSPALVADHAPRVSLQNPWPHLALSNIS